MSGVTFVVHGVRCGVAAEHARALADRLRASANGSETPALAAAELIEACAESRWMLPLELCWTDREQAEIRAALEGWTDAPLDVAALRDALDGRLAA